jgi:hypothetical protein
VVYGLWPGAREWRQQGADRRQNHDGKTFVKERVELARHQEIFWQSWKFMKMLTTTVELKQICCEWLDKTTAFDGIYQ